LFVLVHFFQQMVAAIWLWCKIKQNKKGLENSLTL
jgi:hypothetical protein